MNYPLSLHPCNCSMSSQFSVLAILIGALFYLIVVLLCTSSMVNDAEHLSVYLFEICMSSSVKYLFMSFVHFRIGLFSVAVDF